MKCLDKRVLIGLGVVAAGLFVAWPNVALVAAPLLVAAVCPLSMLLVMRRGQGRSSCGRGGGSPVESAHMREAELAALRAEIDYLNAQQRAQQSNSATADQRP